MIDELKSSRTSESSLSSSSSSSSVTMTRSDSSSFCGKRLKPPYRLLSERDDDLRFFVDDFNTSLKRIRSLFFNEERKVSFLFNKFTVVDNNIEQNRNVDDV
ncbi:hypothetical protein DERF_003799 [Dermatophagoides farinae]|uniref:Uncharacterized protein n=1 Tax=Dermatophagoides farinae TaxID=6954 RepID=A0A922IFD3_DERFA|nr:hypothetical protein DERF_003799 [Dermatophagoides farinae]